jgi:hypothetical protein
LAATTQEFKSSPYWKYLKVTRTKTPGQEQPTIKK